jgi:anti-sigma factor RsiW
MNCSDFLARFNDYLDGPAPTEGLEWMEDHLGGCDSCTRYRTVLERGAAVLRALPEPELRDDFEPRLRHRLYHVDDERAVTALQSGAPALTVFGIAVLLTALAWAPTLRARATDVLLEPIVVDRAPRRASPFRAVSFAPRGAFSTKNQADLDDGLWDNAFLYEYSALSQRYSQRARVRRAGEPDR